MSAVSSVSALPEGAQQLFDRGLLPSSLNSSVLNEASASQLNQLAGSSIALQEIGTLFGIGNASTDSATLSSAASNALLREINPSSSSDASGMDVLNEAVANQLSSKLNEAVNKFLPAAPSTSGQINLLG